MFLLDIPEPKETREDGSPSYNPESIDIFDYEDDVSFLDLANENDDETESDGWW